MKTIITEFDATLLYDFDDVIGVEGLIIESRGGTATSNNYRNPEHSLLLAFVLQKLQSMAITDLKIYVASNSKTYKKPEDRLITYEGNSVINLSSLNDFDTFLKSVKKSIKQSGQYPDSAGGNSTKRLLLSSKSVDLSNLFSEELDIIIDSKTESELEYTYRKIKRRLRQSKFRKELLEAYNNTCAVSGSKVTQLLEAAHIQPYNGAHTSTVNNGILLRSDIHDLFDTYVDNKNIRSNRSLLRNYSSLLPPVRSRRSKCRNC